MDLAGSEKISNHYDSLEPDELFSHDFGNPARGMVPTVKNRVNEGKNINKSLFFLT